MALLDFLNTKKAPSTGYVLDSEDYLRNLPKHELFGGNAVSAPDWASLAPSFRNQESTMMCTAFAGTSAATMLNRRETGAEVLFSPVELFTRANGTIGGNTIEATERAMRQAVVPETEAPWVGPVSYWDPYVLKLMGAYARARTQNAPEKTGADFAIRSLTRVLTDRVSLAKALGDSPLIATLQVGRGYFDKVAPNPTSGPFHAVDITRVGSDGSILVFDSITNRAGFDGFHWLAPDFELVSAFGILDLPNDWQDAQSHHETNTNPFAMARYGEQRNPPAEADAAKALHEARKRNPTHAQYLDDAWNLYVVALAYGRYSAQDILNHITSIRRGKGPIFDLNAKRTK